ncbi:ribonuclease P protein component [Tranquillimonas alkanivorans]|uniref:Ribonuclease P protein component n=1 Tax=Tranquillimonas alkanivorans TaxID=441119 RepID=A0A1I5TCV1_9RHOB|nr:ribonuclease P protein component [Tranquillimonas alkanivorans]SFP80873.1 ribonuclease P protein component [Tranquillimonas alkanivorans]
MTPPEAGATGASAKVADGLAAVSSCPEILRKRADFLKAARAKRQGAPAFMLQARKRAPEEAPGRVRIGYTCSKKVGNAVARNRAKRRLREIARAVLPHHGRPGWDYVLIGRKDATAKRPLPRMIEDLERALAQVHR